MKQIEIFIAKFRILLNDIELISYDIEQLKQSDYEDKQSILLINNRWEELLKQTNEKYHSLENQFEQMKFKQKLFDQIYHELNLIDKQVNESTINTKFALIIERLENIEQQINKEFTDDNNELKSK
jgi:glycyl-tRNA synthetase beta subunit